MLWRGHFYHSLKFSGTAGSIFNTKLCSTAHNEKCSSVWPVYFCIVTHRELKEQNHLFSYFWIARLELLTGSVTENSSVVWCCIVSTCTPLLKCLWACVNLKKKTLRCFEKSVIIYKLTGCNGEKVWNCSHCSTSGVAIHRVKGRSNITGSLKLLAL